MPAELSVQLFGPPRIECQGLAVHIPCRKAVALLAYLAATHEPHSRDALATLLWPDLGQAQACAMVRHALLALHQVLGKRWLVISTDLVALPAQPGLWVDSCEFQKQIVQVAAHTHPALDGCESCIAALTAAADLYRDTFLAGFSLPDTDVFEAWQRAQAQRLQQEAVAVLAALACLYARCGQQQYTVAIDYAHRLLALDPTHEPAHCTLMRLYAWSGDRTAALRQFQVCQQFLATELGLEPTAATTALAARNPRGSCQRKG